MSELSFTIYEPKRIEKDLLNRADELVFIKDGFAFWAMIAPPLWLIYHKLWLPLIGVIAALVFVKLLGWLFSLDTDALGLLVAGLSVAFGFLANDLRRFFLEQKNYHMVGAIAGPSQIECERRFFHNWAPLSNHLSPLSPQLGNEENI